MSSFLSNVSGMMAVRGVLAILFGLVALVWPGITLTALLILFGAFAFVDGVSALVLAFSNGDPVIPRWVLALDGVAGIIVAVIAFFAPGITSLALLYIIATWCLITGSLLIGGAIVGARFEPGWLMVLHGAISVALGIALIAWPGTGILAIVWTLGLYGIFTGFAMLIASFSLSDQAAGLASGQTGYAAR
jgi:uncharacterized membrane protein HdeD (DUF308 family)